MGKSHSLRNRFEALDVVLTVLLVLCALAIIIPVLYMVVVSFTTAKEYTESIWLFWPKNPTTSQYAAILGDQRILVGYKTTLFYLIVGVPLNLFLSTCMAYGLACRGWPGRRMVLFLVLLTMIFNGGTVPMYLTMRAYGLTNTVWAVILPNGMNTFNMILIYNYFNSLPTSLQESARIDGASEWTILFKIALPLAKPVLATVSLFVIISLWNEYFYSMIFLRNNNWFSLQQVLRSVVVDASQTTNISGLSADSARAVFSDGVKMAAVVVTMVPVICIYPLLQKYFVKGVTIGAIK